MLRLVLSACLARGARLAEPGEFTLRAFLSGRIDLTQSEAVLGVIDATTPAQLDAALRQLAGGLASPIRSLRDRLADVLAHLEANLDFAEEPDVDPLGRRGARASRSTRPPPRSDALADRLRGRDRPEGRPRVVLVGPPNAGKSRLFNALLGIDRAIVSPVAGTTRDYLEAPCDCDGLLVDLVDTAGFEDARGAIEGHAQAARVDQSATRRPPARLPGRRHRRSRRIRTAGRPPEAPRLDQGRRLDPPRSRPIGCPPAPRPAKGSTRSDGAIAGALRSKAVDGDLPAGTAARCGESLARAGRFARMRPPRPSDSGGGDELVAVDLRQALDDLGRVVGAVVTDDLLDRIFRRFCIGK